MTATWRTSIVYELPSLGFGPYFEQQLHSPHDGELAVARIAAEHRGAYEVWSAAGAGRAQLAGRLRLELERSGPPGVGDWLVVRDLPSPDRTILIERVLGSGLPRHDPSPTRAPPWRRPAARHLWDARAAAPR